MSSNFVITTQMIKESVELTRKRKARAQAQRTDATKRNRSDRKQGRQNGSVMHQLEPFERRMLWNNLMKQDADSKVIKRISNATEPIPFSDCWVPSSKKWTNTSNRYSFYPQSYSQFGLKSKVTLHVLALFIRSEQIADNPNVASHLCHRRSCFNPEHIILEHNKKNLERTCCVRAARADDKVIDVCPHKPKCLRRDTDNIDANWTATVVNNAEE
jgi:Zinc-binding loop region of homing endonuclease